MSEHITDHDTKPQPEERYGYQDTPYKAAGEFAGIQTLVKNFYEFMNTLPEAQGIRAMHSHELAEIDCKLTHFLCYWLGGPRSFIAKHGPVSIPAAHRHLPIGSKERDAWLLCMQKAIALQPYRESFKQYLLEQLAVPAERIRVECEPNLEGAKQ